MVSLQECEDMLQSLDQILSKLSFELKDQEFSTFVDTEIFTRHIQDLLDEIEHG